MFPFTFVSSLKEITYMAFRDAIRADLHLCSPSLFLFLSCYKTHYYISLLVCALWLVNLAGRTLLYDPLKFNLILLQSCFVIYRQLFLTFIASKNLKLFFTLNYVLKRANDLKTISNWIILLSRCVRNLKPFRVNIKNRSWTPQTHSRDIINILLTSFSRSVL